MKKEENESLLLRAISILRFPLMVLVVMIHVRFDAVIDIPDVDEYDSYFFSLSVISGNLASCAVPLFFIFSGYLFFYKIYEFKINIYINKLNRRLKSLLLPYLIWNIIALVFLFFMQALNMNSNIKLIKDYSFFDWFWSFWDVTKVFNEAGTTTVGSPIAFQFWFIRDLMVVILFSPLIYLLIKKIGFIAVMCLGFCYVFDWGFKFPGFYIVAPFFFSLGAYFSIKRKDIVPLLTRYVYFFIIIYIVFSILIYLFNDFVYIKIFKNINTLVLLTTIMGISLKLVSDRKLKENKFLISSNMFIFGFHAIPLRFICKVLFSSVLSLNPFLLTLAYFITPIIVILISLGIYYVLHHYLPRFTAVLTGGR